MTWTTQLTERLETISAVTGALGSGSAMRLYALQAPANTTAPYAVFQLISRDDDDVLTGAAIGSRLLVQFDIFAGSYQALNALDVGFRSAFSGWAPSTGPVLSTSIVGAQDGIEPLTNIFRRIIDVAVEIEE